jgi:MFS family permease
MNQPGRGIFYGWWVVLAAAVGLFWGAPITVFSFGIFLKPLMREFHAGRAAVSLAYTLQLIASAISAPLAGWLVDRYGARRVILPATALFGLILLSTQFFSGGIRQFYLLYPASGLFVHGAGPIPYGSVVSHWFDRRRGLALGLMMIGIGAGATILPAFAQKLITGFGWRTAYAVLGAAVLAIPIPVVTALLKEEPQALGLLPDGAVSINCGLAREARSRGLSVYDAARHPTFWLQICAFFLVGASVQGCLVHMAAMLSDGGASVQTAALGSSLMGAAVLIGRVGTGYLLDRFFAPRVAALLFGGTAVGIGVLWIGSATLVALAGAFLIGLGLGAEVDIIAYLMGRYFGLRSFGKLYSFAFGAFVLAGALGPLAMGSGFDRMGSYRIPLAVLFALTLVATVLMTRLGPYPYRAFQEGPRAPLLPAAAERQS